MLALKTSGECILLALKTLTITFEKKVLARENPQPAFMKCFGIIMLCQFSVICLFSVVTMYMDDYSFLDGIYCWFITFTTIGFGDIVPFQNFLSKSENQRFIHVIGFFLTIPYVIGLCLVFSLLNLLVESSENIKVQLRTFCTCRADKKKRISTDSMHTSNIRLENYTDMTA